MAQRAGALSPKIRVCDLSGKVAIITGATRGIGRTCALALAKQGCSIVVAAKTVKPDPERPGTIYSVAEEVESLGAKALPVQVDMRKLVDVQALVRLTMEKFGRIDVVINNASDVWWQRMENTPIHKYDHVQQINARGVFALTTLCLPIMEQQKWGRVICMSPPIRTDYKAFNGCTAYNMSKYSMTMVAMGAAAEYEGKGIAAHALWPATVIESPTAGDWKAGDRAHWRRGEILSDVVLCLLAAPDSYTGQQLIDDEYLIEQQGLTARDLAIYRCDPKVEPERILAAEAGRPAQVSKL
mmetsp:Transcript_44748/g.130276  ORF Transcript_44748/g.130276 Transcript_44748/m.130276 type:complete len:298 (+) Transcript_44748:136-1029(+)